MWPRWPTLKVARVLAAPIDKAHPLLKPPSESWPRSSRLATTQELALLSEDGYALSVLLIHAVTLTVAFAADSSSTWREALILL